MNEIRIASPVMMKDIFDSLHLHITTIIQEIHVTENPETKEVLRKKQLRLENTANSFSDVIQRIDV